MTRFILWVVAMAIIGTFVLALVGAVITVANAQEHRGPDGRACNSYGNIVEFYGWSGKVPVARGMGEDDNVIEVLASPDGKFIVVIVYPDKWTCVIRHGVGWNDISKYLHEDAAPAQ